MTEGKALARDAHPDGTHLQTASTLTARPWQALFTDATAPVQTRVSCTAQCAEANALLPDQATPHFPRPATDKPSQAPLPVRSTQLSGKHLQAADMVREGPNV